MTFNGPLTGTGTLTIVGGTVNLNCANALPLTVVGQGTLVIGGSINGPVTTQGSGTVQNSANNKIVAACPVDAKFDGKHPEKKRVAAHDAKADG